MSTPNRSFIAKLSNIVNLDIIYKTICIIFFYMKIKRDLFLPSSRMHSSNLFSTTCLGAKHLKFDSS